MMQRFYMAVESRGVTWSAVLNGAPILVAQKGQLTSLRELQPFVITGHNTLVVTGAGTGERDARIRVRIVEGVTAGPTTIAEQLLTPAAEEAFELRIAFAAAIPQPPVMAASRCEALSETDVGEIEQLLTRVHCAVASQRPGDVVPLFSRWIERYAMVRGMTRAAVEAALVQQLERLGDPGFSLLPIGKPAMKLVCQGDLCVATASDGRPVLGAVTDAGEIRLSLVFSKIDGEWSIVA